MGDNTERRFWVDYTIGISFYLDDLSLLERARQEWITFLDALSQINGGEYEVAFNTAYFETDTPHQVHDQDANDYPNLDEAQRRFSQQPVAMRLEDV